MVTGHLSHATGGVFGRPKLMDALQTSANGPQGEWRIAVGLRVVVIFKGFERTLPLADRRDAIDALFLGALHNGHRGNALLGIHQDSAAADGHIVRHQVERDVAGCRELHSSTQNLNQRAGRVIIGLILPRPPPPPADCDYCGALG